MPIYKVPLTIAQQKHVAEIDRFGEGDIPLLIIGHAEVYAELLKRTFDKYGLLKKFTLYVPKLYWCEDAPLSKIPVEDITKNGLVSLVEHLEYIRKGLAEEGLLKKSDNKIGLYCHSGFSALAFQYATSFPDATLFIQAEGPPPYFTEEWAKEKKIFFDANFRRKDELGNPKYNQRSEALKKEGVEADQSAVDEKNMQDFPSFRDAYHKMSPTLFYNFEQDHRKEIWGDNVLNMKMMHAFFYKLVVDYDCRKFIDKVTCPVHLSLGVYDVPVPSYLWIDSTKKGGIGFFRANDKDEKDSAKRDYYLHTESGHWPVLEEPEAYCKALNNFIDEKVLPELKNNNTFWK